MNTNANRAKNITVSKRAEAKAANANATKLQTLKVNAKKPEPKVLQKGSGALIGVAKGAMDGQPHTKLAVEQAREREQAAKRGEVDAVLAKLAAEEKATPKKVSGTEFPTVKAAAARRAQVRASLEFAAKQPVKASTGEPKAKATKKAAAPKTPRVTANRAYAKGATKNEAKPGTWRHHMLTMIQAHKSTDDAKAAHAKSGEYVGQALDFNWAAKQGYIAFKG
jgi:hypothetical protein